MPGRTWMLLAARGARLTTVAVANSKHPSGRYRAGVAVGQDPEGSVGDRSERCSVRSGLFLFGASMTIRTRLSQDGTFEYWQRERAQTLDFYVVHITSGQYLHTDGRLHKVRQYFGAMRFAARAVNRWASLKERV